MDNSKSKSVQAIDQSSQNKMDDKNISSEVNNQHYENLLDRLLSEEMLSKEELIGIKDIFEIMVIFYEQSDDNSTIDLEILSILGKVYIELKEYEKAKNLFERALTLDVKFDNESIAVAISILYSLVTIYINLNDFEKAKVIIEKFTTYNKIDTVDPLNYIVINSKLGIIYLELKEYENANDTLEKSLILFDKLYHNKEITNQVKLTDKLNFFEPKIIVIKNLGKAYYGLKEHENAKKTFEGALTLYDKMDIKDINLKAEILINLGTVCQELGLLEKAVDYQIKYFELENKKQENSDSGNIESLAVLYYTKARFLIESGHWYKGLDYFNKCLTIQREQNDLLAQADTIYHIARTNFLMQNYDKGIIHYRDAVRLYEHENNFEGSANCKLGLGSIMLTLSRTDDATEYYQEAKKLYRQIDNREKLADAEELLQYTYEIRDKKLVRY